MNQYEIDFKQGYGYDIDNGEWLEEIDESRAEIERKEESEEVCSKI